MPSEIIWNILLVLYILLIYHLLGSYRSKSLNMNYLQNICHIGICTMQQQVYTFLHGKLYFCCHTFYHRFFELVAVFLNGRRYVYRKGKSKNIEYKFNRYMPYITHSVLLHAYLKRSQILLTLSNHQVICGVFSIFPLCRSYM